MPSFPALQACGIMPGPSSFQSCLKKTIPLHTSTTIGPDLLPCRFRLRDTQIAAINIVICGRSLPVWQLPDQGTDVD